MESEVEVWRQWLAGIDSGTGVVVNVSGIGGGVGERRQTIASQCGPSVCWRKMYLVTQNRSSSHEVDYHHHDQLCPAIFPGRYANM